MAGALELAQEVGTARACRALGVPRASLYRQRRVPAPVAAPRPRPARALTAPERQTVLDLLHSERFVDQAPAEVYATLLDEGTSHCSPRTMYRLLAEAQEVRERRNQLRHVAPKPELLATGPNQVWSWDITKLLGPAKWTYFSLYVILDIFSRYVVGWMVAHQESATLAERLIGTTCENQAIAPGQLLIHADRGPAMTSKPVALLLADLGVTRTHSRPHVSNDTPYSEAQFKTLKYRPEFPERFGFIEEARALCQRLFAWYNTEHHHSGLGLLTPEVVHYGWVDQILAQRRHVLASAYAAHPERFVQKPPAPLAVPTAVWINRPDPPARPHPEGAKGGYPDRPGPPIVDPGGAEPLASWGAWPPNPSFTPIHALQVVRRRSSAAAQHDETSTRVAHADQPAPAAPASAKALQSMRRVGVSQSLTTSGRRVQLD